LINNIKNDEFENINFKHIILSWVENSWTKLTNKENGIKFHFGFVYVLLLLVSEFANFMVLICYLKQIPSCWNLINVLLAILTISDMLLVGIELCPRISEDLFSINILETNWIACHISAFLFHTLIVDHMDNDCNWIQPLHLYLSQWNLYSIFHQVIMTFGMMIIWTLCFNFVFLIEFYPDFTMKVEFHTIHNIVSVRFYIQLKTQKILFFISLYFFLCNRNWNIIIFLLGIFS